LLGLTHTFPLVKRHPTMKGNTFDAYDEDDDKNDDDDDDKILGQPDVTRSKLVSSS
jgi:hypothetical protein